MNLPNETFQPYTTEFDMLVQIEILGFTDHEMQNLMGDFALVSETPESDLPPKGSTDPDLVREIPVIKDVRRREIKLIAPEIELINNR